MVGIFRPSSLSTINLAYLFLGNKILHNLMRWRLKHPIRPMYKDGGLALFGCNVFVIALMLNKRGFDMKKILVATLIGTMLLALSTAADVTKSTTTTTSTAPATPSLQARLNQRLRLARLLASRQHLP
jgi:hypothetical protein